MDPPAASASPTPADAPHRPGSEQEPSLRPGEDGAGASSSPVFLLQGAQLPFCTFPGKQVGIIQRLLDTSPPFPGWCIGVAPTQGQGNLLWPALAS